MQGARWAPGAIVGEYRLLERLGQGGMGAVDLALHLPTGARRAIKSLPTSADAELVLRFRREAEALARVDRHPGVVRVHAVGVAHDRHYLVMDHLPGGDLERRLAGGPLAPVEAARLGIDLARALAHVHARGVLHRDLKPSNVLFDEHGAPTLVDFGLARSAVDARALTVTGELLGTPAYMAPEQARGDAREVDARTDVYGLGATLYHALSGRPPSEGRSALEVLARAEQGLRARLRELRPEVPAALERVVERALARDPDDRFACAEDLARALEVALRGGDRAPRRGLLVGLGLVGGLAAVVLLAASPAPRPDPRTPDEPKAPGTTRASDVVATTSKAPPSTPSSTDRRRLAERVEDVGDPPTELPEWLGGQRVVAEVMSPVALAGSLLERSDPDDARAMTLTAQLCAREVRDGGPDELQAWVILGRLFREGLGVQQSNDEALRCLRTALDRGHPEAAQVLGRAYCVGELGLERDLPRGRELLRQVVKAPAGTPGLPWELQRRACLELGWVAVHDPGEETDREALEVLADVDHPEAVLIRAELLRRGGRGDDEQVIQTLEAAARDARVAGEALRALIQLHGEAGRSEQVAHARARLEALAAEEHSGACLALAGVLLVEVPGDLRRPAELLATSAAGGGAHSRSARIELLRLCRREEAAGRAPPVPLARVEELVRRERDGDALLRDVR